MLCVWVLLHCQQICAERKFRKIKRTYLYSIYSSTTSNVTMCIDSLEWRAQEVCLLQNNYEWTLINKQLERVNNTSLCKKKLRKLQSLQYDNMHQFSGAAWMNRAAVLWLIGYSQVWKQPHWPKVSQSESCFGMVQVNCPFDGISFFFFYSKIDLNLFTYCFFKAYILLMDQRSLRSWAYLH